MTSIKGYDPVRIYAKMTGNNHNLDIVKINTYDIKFGLILYICSKYIKRKQNPGIKSRAITPSQIRQK